MTNKQSKRFELMVRYIELDKILEILKDEKEIEEIKKMKKAIRTKLELDA